MQIRGEAAGRGGQFFFSFSQYLMSFAKITGSKIKKHVGESTRGGVRPIGGCYDPHPSGSGRNTRHWVVHPPPHTSPSVFLILLLLHLV